MYNKYTHETCGLCEIVNVCTKPNILPTTNTQTTTTFQQNENTVA